MVRGFLPFPRLSIATALAIVPALGLPVGLPLGLHAQGPSARPAATPPAASRALKVLNLEDYAGWNRIGSTALSHDGKWMTFTYTPNEGADPVLHVKALDGDKDYSTSLGTAPGGAGGRAAGGGRGAAAGNAPSFSDDSHWAAYIVNPAGTGGGRGGRGGRGGPAPGGRAGAQATQAPATPGHLELLNLATGQKSEIANVGSWKFSPDSRWIAVHFNRAQPAGGGAGAAAAGAAAPASSGADLILRDLAAGTDLAIGNVNQFEFNETGKLFAYTVDAPEKFGNGVYLLNPATGTTRALNTGSAIYDALAWSNEGTNLAALRGEKSKDMTQRENVLLAWNGLDKANVTTVIYDPAKDPLSFPKGMVLSEYATPRWSQDGTRLFVGIKEQAAEIPAADSIKANVDVWNWRDVVPQAVQIVQIAQTRRATYPAVVLVNTGNFVRLGDPMMRTVTNAANNNVGIGLSDTLYRGEIEWGATRDDFYHVNPEHRRAHADRQDTLAHVRHVSGQQVVPVPQEQAGTRVQSRDGKAVTLDASTIPGKSFLNEDDDHPYEMPLWGVGGWTKDGNSVLLYDKFDVWQAPLTGAKPVNLTKGVGRAQRSSSASCGSDVEAGGRGGRGGGGAAA